MTALGWPTGFGVSAPASLLVLALLGALAVWLLDARDGRLRGRHAARLGSVERWRAGALLVALGSLIALAVPPYLEWQIPAGIPSAEPIPARLRTLPASEAGTMPLQLELGEAEERKAAQTERRATTLEGLRRLPQGRRGAPIDSAASSAEQALANGWPVRLEVEGWGLRAAEWRAGGSGFAVSTFDPTPVPLGFERVAWQRAAVLGESVEIRGAFSMGSSAGGELCPSSTEPLRVELRDPSGTATLAAMAPRPNGDAPVSFRVAFTPRASGPLLLALEARCGERGEVLSEERIDLDVAERARHRVLWIEGAPTAEAAAFRRWLLASGSGSQLTVRSNVSRGRVRVVTHQTSSTPGGVAAIETLRPEALAEFDLVVAEPAALTAAERRRVVEVVENTGGGLLWRRLAPDPEVDTEGFMPRGVRLETVGAAQELDVLLVRARFAGDRLSEPLELPPHELRMNSGDDAGSAGGAAWHPMISDVTGRVLAARRPAGRGWEAVTVADATFRWSLRGAREDYAQWWSQVLERVAADSRPSPWLQIQVDDAESARVDRPLRIEVRTDSPWSEWPPEIDVVGPDAARTRLAPRQDELDPLRVTVATWPATAGWHRVEARTQSGVATSASFWASPRDAWQAQEARRRIDDTRAYAAGDTAERELGGTTASSASLAADQNNAARLRRTLPRSISFGFALAGLALVWGIERWR